MEGEVADGEPGEGGTDGGGERGVRGFVDAAGVGGQTEENASSGAKETRGSGARGRDGDLGAELVEDEVLGVSDCLLADLADVEIRVALSSDDPEEAQKVGM